MHDQTLQCAYQDYDPRITGITLFPAASLFTQHELRSSAHCWCPPPIATFSRQPEQRVRPSTQFPVSVVALCHFLGAFPEHLPQFAVRELPDSGWLLAANGVTSLALSRLHVRTPKRNIVPLSVDEVARFWSGFRTSRDLAIVGLMLLQGLRSQEVLALNQEGLLLSGAQARVHGKGNKIRFLPLAPESIQLLDRYLRLERPSPSPAALFVSLKGRARAARMTRRVAIPVSPPSSDHRREARQPTPVPPLCWVPDYSG
ncbi:MAG: integrase [Candidatus Solibacter sp.]|jgi:hypothetical protein|nr:integrase [Candidatus Solibacter sp.]